MQEINGSLVGPKMSLVLSNFNGFAKPPLKRETNDTFWHLVIFIEMQEISGSLVDPKMSLVLCNFNGFAKTIKNQWKSDMF